MASPASDRREFPSTFHRHYLDDPLFDFAKDEAEGSGGRLAFCLIAAVVLVLLVLGMHWYLAPPEPYFVPVIAVDKKSGKNVVGFDITQYSPGVGPQAFACDLNAGQSSAVCTTTSSSSATCSNCGVSVTRKAVR